MKLATDFINESKTNISAKTAKSILDILEAKMIELVGKDEKLIRKEHKWNFADGWSVAIDSRNAYNIWLRVSISDTQKLDFEFSVPDGNTSRSHTLIYKWPYDGVESHLLLAIRTFANNPEFNSAAAARVKHYKAQTKGFAEFYKNNPNPD